LDIARTAIGVAVREGAPKPDISTVDAFKRALLEAKSIVYNDPAIGATSGIHFASVLQRLGIADAVKSKSVLWQGGYAAEAILKGQAELCVHQISELLPVKGVVMVGPLPAELNKVTTYSSSLLPSASDAGRAFHAYLARPEFRAKFAAAGLDYK
jgi:molybdate transport system substrate-binding protein